MLCKHAVSDANLSIRSRIRAGMATSSVESISALRIRSDRQAKTAAATIRKQSAHDRQSCSSTLCLTFGDGSRSSQLAIQQEPH